MPLDPYPDPADDVPGEALLGLVAPHASASTSAGGPSVGTSRSRSRHDLRRRGLGLAVMSAGATALLLGFQSPGLGATPTDAAVVDATPTTAASAEPCASVSPAMSPTASLAPAGSPAVSAVPCVPVTGPAASVPVAVDQVLVGQVVQTRYGDIQVQITVNGTQITDVQALQLPHDRDYSAQISDYVEPYLRQMALQAQSAHIDVISGATYTSEGYAASLQSAIDQMATVQ